MSARITAFKEIRGQVDPTIHIVRLRFPKLRALRSQDESKSLLVQRLSWIPKMGQLEKCGDQLNEDAPFPVRKLT